MTIAFDGADARFSLPSCLPRLLLLAGLVAYAGMLVAGWWAISGRLPDQIVLSLAGHAFAVKHIHDKLLGTGALLLLILPSAFWIEAAVVGWKKSSLRALTAPTPSLKTDIAFFLMDQAHLTGLVGRVLMLGLSVISGVALRDWLAARTGFAIDPTALPLVAAGDRLFHRLFLLRLLGAPPGPQQIFLAAAPLSSFGGRLQRAQCGAHPSRRFCRHLLHQHSHAAAGRHARSDDLGQCRNRHAGLCHPFAHGIGLRLAGPLYHPVAAASPPASQAGHEPRPPAFSA